MIGKTAQPAEWDSSIIMYCGISLNLDSNLLSTALPLLEDEAIEAIEWSFDALFHHENIPDWFEQLIKAFSSEGRLIGHGVYYSLFSGRWTKEQQYWLDSLRSSASKYNFDHVSEHFGYMTGQDFHKGAPLSVPYNQVTLSIAKDRISRMQDACQCPVGLENLAFSYSLDEVRKNGEFINEILESINGFLILDLHNVYCQVQNFDLSFEEILACYPIDRVREVHLSGGSWEESEIKPETKIRRDTHDDSVPSDVYQYLRKVLPILKNLKFVMLEQLGTDLKKNDSQREFQQDFKYMKSIVEDFSKLRISDVNSFLPEQISISDVPLQSDVLAKQQKALDEILEQSLNFNEVKQRLHQSILKSTDWKIEEWEDTMLETAFKINQKWKEGFII